jgi:indolepyruvate ferredoxin oxidoreductase
MASVQVTETVDAEAKVYLSGTEALVRALLAQSARDEAAGARTAGFVSGYRGSPLGHVDEQMWAAAQELRARDIVFQPGVNEDLAATAVWGTQQIGFFKDPTVQGVFGLWYGKGPGVDRSGDALRHANLWGTAPLGGVVMIAGDDPMARSSSIQQQSEHVLASLAIPTFSAGSVQDLYDYCLIGWQLSRYAGVWSAVKSVSDIIESSSPVDQDPRRTLTRVPEDFTIEPPGVHIRWPDMSPQQDERLMTRRLPAVQAFLRANPLNRVTFGAATPRLGIVTHGKSHTDTLEALAGLGVDAVVASRIGLAVFKLGVIWPLEHVGIREFARGLDELLVIEEGRAFVEPAIRNALYGMNTARLPVVSGKDIRGHANALASHGELTSAGIARAVAEWLAPHFQSPAIDSRVAALNDLERRLGGRSPLVARLPYFCSGCPHNTSTRVPEGSVQLAGIGCHTLAMIMDRGVVGYPQMGGEGAAWVGASPFVATGHTFVNVGDGTFYHSGSMAIRQAIAAKVNATYKILYNDAVAMTGGQPVDGPISVAAITHQMLSEGAVRVAVVSDSPGKYDASVLAPGATLHHRDELDQLQREFRAIRGVTVIIYEQTCATELRRRRKRKLVADPARRVVINARTCEGCGDCGKQSNCLSVQPLETAFGRKRTIDQSSCNKDMSCVKGFCPSFVTVEGGGLALPATATGSMPAFGNLPEEAVAPVDGVHSTVITGIGGTGVVTVSALLGAAARIENRAVQVLDLTGMSQKFGAVFCHVKIAADDSQLRTPRIAQGTTQLLIGADLVASAQTESLALLRQGVSCAVVNDRQTLTGTFTRDRDFRLPGQEMAEAIGDFCGPGRALFVDATGVSEVLTGDSIGANLLLLGVASQRGLLPLSAASIERAVSEQGLAVAYNLNAFRLGRLLAHDPAAIATAVTSARGVVTANEMPKTLDELIEHHASDLVSFQDTAYAHRYRALVKRVRSLERFRIAGKTALTEAVARNYHKLLAYKDEYEVARHLSSPEFLASIRARFSGRYRIRFHLAPPLQALLGGNSATPRKRTFGAWMVPVFRVLARLKGLRGTAFDPFGHTAERRMERELIRNYERLIDLLMERLSTDNFDTAVALASIPEQIRGYGHVKSESVRKSNAEEARLMDMLEGGKPAVGRAA